MTAKTTINHLSRILSFRPNLIGSHNQHSKSIKNEFTYVCWLVGFFFNLEMLLFGFLLFFLLFGNVVACKFALIFVSD